MARWFRRIAYVLGTLVVLVMVLAGFVMVKSDDIVSKKYLLAAEPIAMSLDSATLARGQHLVEAITKCTDCHADDWGGKEFINDPAFMQLNASNLTKGEGGIGNQYTDAQLATLIRHGIKPDSTSVIIMPSDAYQDLSDSDVAAIVAYMRAQPPVNRTFSKPVLGPVAKALTTFGQLPVFVAASVAPDRPHVATVTPGATVAYGKYLADVGGCTTCHGPGLGGGNRAAEPADWPQSSNLTPKGIGHYTDAQLEIALRTGKRPDGSLLKDQMPWKYTAKLTPEEMTATILYLRSVPPKEFGTR